MKKNPKYPIAPDELTNSIRKDCVPKKPAKSIKTHTISMNIIVAASKRNQLIGVNNSLPWHLGDDLRLFSSITSGQVVIMGRKNYESIGRPLPGRENIILTRDRSYRVDGCTVCHSFDDSIIEAKKHFKNIFFIGGSEIYKLAFPICENIFYTEVDCGDLSGDTYLDLDISNCREVYSARYKKSDKNDYDFLFRILKK